MTKQKDLEGEIERHYKLSELVKSNPSKHKECLDNIKYLQELYKNRFGTEYKPRNQEDRYATESGSWFKGDIR